MSAIKVRRQKFNDVSNHLNQTVLEMHSEIRSVMALLISGQHGFFLGLPGVGKSFLIGQLSKLIECNYYRKLITATTTPSEIFGPFSLKELKNDRYHFNTAGHLPTAHIAFLDEMFKGNSQTLNGNLTAMEERLFDNGAVTEKIPLISLFAASNELPGDESLEALWDRFTVRMEVRPLDSEESFIRMLRAEKITPPDSLTIDDIEAACQEASEVEVTDKFVKSVYDLRRNIEATLGGDLYVSDRRWKHIVEFMKALAWMDDEPLTEDYFIEITNCLWSTPQQIPQINSVLTQYVDPSIGRAEALYGEVVAIFEGLQKELINKSATIDDVSSGYAALRDKKDQLEVLMNRSSKVEKILPALVADFDLKFNTIRTTYMKLQNIL
jgi:MoxR-like ATPase